MPQRSNSRRLWRRRSKRGLFREVAVFLDPLVSCPESWIETLDRFIAGNAVAGAIFCTLPTAYNRESNPIFPGRTFQATEPDRPLGLCELNQGGSRTLPHHCRRLGFHSARNGSVKIRKLIGQRHDWGLPASPPEELRHSRQNVFRRFPTWNAPDRPLPSRSQMTIMTNMTL